MWLAWAIGCGLPPGPGAPVDVPDLEPPTISSFELGCDADRGVWTLRVDATAWTGGGVTWWTVDGAYFERHSVKSTSYAEDGSAEHLELALGIVSDWRAQVDGSSTAFTCADRVDVVFTLEDLDGKTVDCRVTGPDPLRWQDIEGTPSCDLIWP